MSDNAGRYVSHRINSNIYIHIYIIEFFFNVEYTVKFEEVKQETFKAFFSKIIFLMNL